MKRKITGILAVVMVVTMLLGTMFTAVAENNKIIITGETVHVRESASLNGKKMGTVSKDKILTGTGIEKKDDRKVTWYQVIYNSKKGWVSSKYSEIYTGEKASGYIYATTGSTYIRNTYATTGKIVGILSKGEKASYLGEQKADSRKVIWYKVKYENVTGWVSSKFTSTKNDAVTSKKTVTAVDGKTYVRNSYNLSATIMGTLQKGKSLTYLGETRYDDRKVAWYKVDLNGKTGWVSSKYTKLAG